MKITLIRHATVLLEYAGQKVLLDPYLSPQGAQAPVPTKDRTRSLRNPLVPLPPRFREPSAWNDLDGILLSHLHFDHFEGFDYFPELFKLKIFAPARLKDKVLKKGFSSFQSLEHPGALGDIHITLTPGRHGRGLSGLLMGKVNGFLLSHKTEPTVYFPGDTVLTRGVVEALKIHTPEVVVPNLGKATLPFGAAITMGAEDLNNLRELVPASRLFPIHLDSVNHCVETRVTYRTTFFREIDSGQIVLLEDGESAYLEKGF